MKHQCYFCGKDVDIRTGDKIDRGAYITDSKTTGQEGQIAQAGETVTCDYNTVASESSKNYYVVGTQSGVCICAECIRNGGKSFYIEYEKEGKQ